MALEPTIRRWLAATGGRSVPTGLSVDEAMARAQDLCQPLDINGLRPGGGEHLADLLFARCAILRHKDCLTELEFESVVETYRAVAAREWEKDAFAERQELLSCLAFGVWSQCLRYRTYQEMYFWERTCVGHVLTMEPVLGFFDLALGQRSQSLCSRFLGDPAVLLALCHRLGEERNRSPVGVAAEAAWAWAWLEAHDSVLLPVERSYIGGEVALSAAGATRHLGKLAESSSWAMLAERALTACETTARFLPKVEFARLSILHDRLEVAGVVSRAPHVIAELEKLGPSLELSRCRLLEACALKNAGRNAEARHRLEGLLVCEPPYTDSLLIGLALVNLGEVEARQGQHELAMNHMKSALPSLSMSATPWALAHVQAALGEVLRDRGELSEAIEAYRTAVVLYGKLRMEWQMTYVRIILAESLISVGREAEAEAELLAALPILEREQVVPAAIAAIGLLRESLSRRAVDVQTLHRLRESLASSLQGTQL